jgi:hypothetical protein
MGCKTRFGVDRAGRLLAAAALAVGAVVAVQVAPPAGDGGSVSATAPTCTAEVPTQNSDNKYVIDTPGKLLHVASNPSTFASVSLLQTAPLDLTNCGNWPGIGAPDTPFTGTFDGGGNTISNLTISSTDDEWGLFRTTGTGASISNLILSSITFSGGWDDYQGALIGSATNTNVASIEVRDLQMDANRKVDDYAGGLIGELLVTQGSVSITDITVEGEMSNEVWGRVGGAIGLAQVDGGNLTVDGVSTNVTLSASGNDIGGAIGELKLSSSATSTVVIVSNVTVSGSTRSTNSRVGGVIGQVNLLAGAATLSALTNTGAVGLAGSIVNETGGLVGLLEAKNAASVVLERSTFAGAVDGRNGTGGLIGALIANTGGQVSIIDNDSLGQVAGEFGTGGVVGRAQMEDGGELRIDRTTASGSVSGGGGEARVGGLIGGLFAATSGENRAYISESSATGAVSGPSGSVGGLIGFVGANALDEIVLTDVFASGDVIGAGTRVGGLIGYAAADGADSQISVINAHATGNVTSSSNLVGGLIGEALADGGAGSVILIDDVSASGAVTSPSSDYVGGLIGKAQASGSTATVIVTNASSSGPVTGDDEVGGLIGHLYANDGSVTLSAATATGAVSSSAGVYIGGLIGHAESSGGVLVIDETMASGSVSGDDEVGGLIGYAENSGSLTLRRSFATGAVVNTDLGGAEEFGGLIGRVLSTGTAIIEDVYALGSVTADSLDQVGGLMGEVGGTGTTNLSRGYATGEVDFSGADVGGLVGKTTVNLSATSSYWDLDTSKLNTSAAGDGRTTDQMKDLDTYVGWSISAGSGGSTTWGICALVNDGYPFLMWQTQLAAGHPGVASCSTGGGTGDGNGDGNGSISPESPSPETTVPEPEPEPAVTGPAPVLVNGAVPQMAPGEIVVYEDGVPVSVQVFVEDDTELVIKASTFDLRLSGECETSCTVEETSDGRFVLTLEQDGTARTEGTGFQPGSVVDVWLFSEPRYLGQVTVGPDGTFTGSVLLGDVEVGEHTLQVNGVTTTGGQRSANMGVLVNSADLETPTLPSAGLGDLAFNWILLLVAAGGLLVLTARRTRRV